MITLTPQSLNDLTIDLGLVSKLGSIGDYVWKDTDRSGTQNIGELGVKDIKVALYVAVNGAISGSPIAQTLTNANGGYLFTGLDIAKKYIVKFDLTSVPADCDPITPLQGNDRTKDSDANVTTGESGVITLTPQNTSDLTIDLGLVSKLGSIGDFVWKDDNNNGLQDTGELGVKDIGVALYQVDNQLGLKLLATTKTNATGYYAFINLPSGNYQVKFDYNTLADGCLPIKPNQGNNDLLDSDADENTGLSPVIVIDVTKTGINRDNPSIDLGLYTPKGSIGDYVWKDSNFNATQDITEKGVPNIKVSLFESINGVFSGPAIAQTVTNANGAYLFSNLTLNKQYIVKFDLTTVPAECEPVTQAKGTNGNIDSDANVLTGETQPVNLTILSPNRTDLDLGLKPKLGSIGDYVWKDANNDGIQDLLEKGIENIIVELYKTNANGVPDALPFAIRRTNAQGAYLFDSLESGNYKVKFQTLGLPADCNKLSDPLKGTSTEKDSDPNVITGFTPLIVIDVKTNGITRNNRTIDAGYHKETPLALGCPLDGGPDKQLCYPETTAQLLPSNAAQSWAFLAGPVTATISANGAITGLSKRGTYRFIMTGTQDGITCRDTVLVKKALLEVPDFSTCENTSKLPAANSGQTWSAFSNNPSAATITQTGQVAGMDLPGNYKFLIVSPVCRDTAIITKLESPAFVASAVSATCNDATANNDGRLILTNFVQGNTYDYTTGNTYTGSKTATSATLIPANGILVNNLSNPSTNAITYTIRVWNQGGCYSDKTVTLFKTVCNCPEPKCVPFVIQKKQ